MQKSTTIRLRPEAFRAAQRIARQHRLKLTDAVSVAMEAWDRLSIDQQLAVLHKPEPAPQAQPVAA